LEYLFASILNNPLNEITDWAIKVGYIALFAIIFSETGLMVGFFLPGDSLLVTAGLFAAKGEFDIFILVPLLIVAAISGNTTGYAIGRKAGQTLFNRPQSKVFRRDHLIKTQQFYEKYGGVTIIMAQFMPFARTFAPVVAGIAEMPYRRFATFNISGAVLWIGSMTMLGYFLGVAFPGVAKHIELVIIAIVFLSILPLIIKYVQHKFGKAAKSPVENEG
jgi:membrane-associated protein